jgi:hypothetical protein
MFFSSHLDVLCLQKNLIGIRELKVLLNACGPKDAKYAGLGIDWFQKKGFDFSEELNTLFIDACVRGQKPEVAVSRFIYGKGRIGAWSTPRSLNKLFKMLRERNDAESMLTVLEALIPKNVRVNNVTITLCLKACCEVQSRNMYLQAVELTRGAVEAEVMEALMEKYPVPEEEVVKEDVEADEEEGGEKKATE